MNVPSLTRRRFLTYAGVTAGVAAAAGGGMYAFDLTQARQAAKEEPLPPAPAGVLVVITLYGGNDGLNTIVPASNPAYQDARPELAYRPDQVLPLGEGLGLSPGLKGLKGLWDENRLAIVRGAGYPKPDHSHFTSMAIWQTADPNGTQRTGWLGRWLDTTGDSLRALTLEPVLPPLLAGATVPPASFPVAGLSLGKGALGAAMAGLGLASSQDSPWQARAAAAYAQTKRTTDLLTPAADKAKQEQVTTQQGESTGAAKESPSQLDLQLSMIAEMVEMGVPCRVYSVSLGGFDTHSSERETQERLLGTLDTALTRFQRRLDRTDRGKQVVTMVYSEFGRRVRANASEGTDHGTAGPMFVLGRGVRGGFHGEQPSLTDLDNGDLKFDIDFRSVYSAMLDKVLGADPARLLGGWSAQWPVLD